MSTLPLLERLLTGRDLTAEEAGDAAALLCDDDTPPAAKGALLALIRHKGATGVELGAFAGYLRSNAATIPSRSPDLVDTCGTGGGSPSFNLSTTAAIVAAAAGASVAKHGNRAVTSSCGSADVLEELGVAILDDPVRIGAVLDSVGIAFAFAPGHHTVMRAVAPIRKDLGFRTIFNQLGPLANPFGANRQLVGVYDRALVRPMAEALVFLGAHSALVVHSADGLDEISPCAPTEAVRVGNGEAETLTLYPDDFGVRSLESSSLTPGATRAEAAAIVREALAKVDSPRSQACVPNAAAALVLAGKAGAWADGAELAREAIASGAASAKLEAFIAATQGAKPC